MADSGIFGDMGLDVEFIEGQSLTRATREVMLGGAQLGFGDATYALELALASASVNVCALMPIYRRSPCSLAYFDRGRPLRLTDLEGARLAGPDGDSSARLLPALLAINKLGQIEYSFATVEPSARDRMLATREVLAVTCFDATLVFSMRAGGYDTIDLRFLYFADHGLDLYTGSLVGSPELFEAMPELPAQLKAGTVEALKACLRDPEKGVSAVMRRRPESDPAIVRDHLTWVLEKNVFRDDAPLVGIQGDRMSFDTESTKMAATVATALAGSGFGAATGERDVAVETVDVESVLPKVFVEADVGRLRV
jgi:ABC-type nitrate/sulfonate/bicarbonate transport system substrate-binding protein